MKLFLLEYDFIMIFMEDVMAVLVIKLFKNRLEIINEKTNTKDIVQAKNPFSNERLLISSITNATECLGNYLKENVKGLIKPKITIIPMDINYEDISEVEVRAIQEFVYKAGAREVIIDKNTGQY